jgi:hypothetical protein
MTETKPQVHRPPVASDVHLVAAIRIDPHAVQTSAGAPTSEQTLLILQDEIASRRRVTEG